MCSLEEAFVDFLEPRNAEPEKKKRKKRTAALPPPEPSVIEPDRPAHRPLPPAELLGGPTTEFTESSSQSEILNAFEPATYFPNPSEDTQNSNMYNLEPDWATSFNDVSAPEWVKSRMASRAAETPLVPSPWMDGASTLWSRIPEPRSIVDSAEKATLGKVDDLQKRLNSMFEKLDEMEVSRAESNHIEIILFILGGIFLLLLIDLIVKQGTQATMLIAAAGGASMPTMMNQWAAMV